MGYLNQVKMHILSKGDRYVHSITAQKCENAIRETDTWRYSQKECEIVNRSFVLGCQHSLPWVSLVPAWPGHSGSPVASLVECQSGSDTTCVNDLTLLKRLTVMLHGATERTEKSVPIFFFFFF